MFRIIPSLRCALILGAVLFNSACFLVKPGPGEACEVDGPEEQCANAEACVGGYCSGGGCDFGDCPGGWTCVSEDGFLFDDKVCRLGCDSDDGCPSTWGCGSGFCRFPRSLIVHVAGPDEVAVGDTASYRVVTESSAGSLTSYSWTVTGMGSADADSLDEATVSVTFEGPGTTQISVSVEDEFNIQPRQSDALRVTAQE